LYIVAPILIEHPFPRTSVDQQFQRAVAVDDQDRRASEPCKAVSSQLQGNPKPQTALNEHPADNETKGEKSLRRFRVPLLTKSSKMRRRMAGE
jgi:hypothetical protein